MQQACVRGLQRFAETRRPALNSPSSGAIPPWRLSSAAFIICLALLPAGIVRFVFFPSVPSDQINIVLKMPQGTSWKKTHDYTLRLEEAARAMDERYRQQTGSETGVIMELMSLSVEDTEAKVTVELLPSTERDITSVELAKWLRESLGELSGVQSLTLNASAGPRVGDRCRAVGPRPHRAARGRR